MNRRLFFAVLLVLAIAATRGSVVHAHGTPIRVETSDEHAEDADERLLVSTGLTDPLGYAPLIHREINDDGEPFATLHLQGFGQATIWQLPGFDIFGLQENSGLLIEPLARPAVVADSVESRVLWYWNPATSAVEPADPTVRLQLRKTEAQQTTISAASPAAPPPLEFAAPVAADMSGHKHFLLYAIDDAAPDGAYGFFARLTSNLYQPSDPLLVVFNRGIFEYERMTEAALAVNAAALLPGDFNRDDRVDAADYTVWRNENLGPEKYLEWKSHFGQSFGGGGQSAAVPEPAAAALTLIFLLGALAFRRKSKPFPPAQLPRQTFAGTRANERV